MKKLIALFLLGFSLLSCTGEPLPDDIKLGQSQTMHKYAIDWDSNQGEPYMELTIYRQGQELHYNNILSKKYEISLYNGDVIMIGINYKMDAPRPECSLIISRYTEMNLSSGIYNPNDVEVLYSLKSNTNGIGYNGIITAEGQLK